MIHLLNYFFYELDSYFIKDWYYYYLVKETWCINDLIIKVETMVIINSMNFSVIINLFMNY